MTPFLFDAQPSRSTDGTLDRRPDAGLSFDLATCSLELWRVVVGLELRPEDMARYLEIKAGRLMGLDNTT